MKKYLSRVKIEADIKGSLCKEDFEKDVPTDPITVTESKECNATTETEVAPTIEKLCRCGDSATIYEFGEIEDGKSDWTYYCNSCKPHTIYCSECGSPAIPYVDSSGKPIFNKCNVHGVRLKVAHADIDIWSRKKRRKSKAEVEDLSKRPF